MFRKKSLNSIIEKCAIFLEHVLNFFIKFPIYSTTLCAYNLKEAKSRIIYVFGIDSHWRIT